MADSSTITREKYNLVRRNQATMQQVNTLLAREANQVLGLASNFDKQQLGGYLRTVIPGLVDKYGNVNAVAAMNYYDDQRLLWSRQNPAVLPSGSAGRKAIINARSGKAQRFAAAKLKSQVYVAKLPTFDVAQKSEPIIGWGMSRFVDEGFQAMQTAVTNSMTRAVGSFNRDTITYNAGLDDAVVSVQRVAEPGACSFCAVIAFGSGTGNSNSRIGSYAADYHDNCQCSIETLYEGDEPLRPDYYDQLEADYVEAALSVGTTDTKQLLAEMRKLSGRK